MLKQVALITCFLALGLSNFAHADVTCQGQWSGKTINASLAMTPGGLKSSLLVDGREVPSMLEFCRFEYRNYRCPHDAGKVRYEISPKMQGNSMTGIVMVVDQENSSQFVELGQCKSASPE